MCLTERPVSSLPVTSTCSARVMRGCSTIWISLSAAVRPSKMCIRDRLYTARQEGSVLTLDFPENVATFRATILDMQTLMNDGVSTVVLQTNKTSTTLNLSLLCDGYSANDKVVLRHIGSRACLTVKGRSRRDLLIGR